MSRYDTMNDDQIDALLLQAEALGWDACIEFFRLATAEVREQMLKEGKDVSH